MISSNVLAARINEENQKLPPVVKFADEMFLSGMRESDINWQIMKNKTPMPALMQFRNRLRDLEKGFRNPGEKE
jgi:hypothetical protein